MVASVASAALRHPADASASAQDWCAHGRPWRVSWACFLHCSGGMGHDLPRWWPIVAGLSALLGLLVSIPVPS